MQISFLCPQHRQWLTQHPERAPALFSQCCDTGEFLFNLGRWQQASRHLGSALDIGEIALLHQLDNERNALDEIFTALTESALLLVACLHHTREAAKAACVLNLMQQRFATLVQGREADDPLRSALKTCLWRLQQAEVGTPLTTTKTHQVH